MANGEITKALIGGAGSGAGAGAGAGFTGGVPSITSSSQARSQSDFRNDGSGWSVYTGASTNKSSSLTPMVIALGIAAVVGVVWFMKRKG